MKKFMIILALGLCNFSWAKPLEIIQIGHPTLRLKAQEIHLADLKSAEFQSLINNMVETMKSAGGVGLAAPQVNRSLRLFVMKSWPSVNLTVVINPTLIYLEEYGKKSSTEGCLSIPGKTLTVSRFKQVLMNYYDREGNFITQQLQGMGAIIAQHEYDHLNGVMIVDLVEELMAKFSLQAYAQAPLM